MYLIFIFIIFLLSISFWHWRSLRGATMLKPIKAASFPSYQSERNVLVDANKWQQYAKKYDALTVQKRRARFTATLNELLTRQSHSASTLPGWYAFSKRMNNLSMNPAKVLRLVGWFILCGMALTAMGQSDEAKEYLERGNAQYKAKEYEAAIQSYRATLGFTLKPTKQASIHYKMALAFNKLNICDSARVHFAAALEKDASTGGASSLAKFDAKARECGFNRAGASNGAINSQDVVSEENTQSYATPDGNVSEANSESPEETGISWFGYVVSAILTFFGSWLVLVIWRGVSGQNRKVAQQQRLDLDRVLNDDEFWNAQQQAGYSPPLVKQVRTVMNKATNTLTPKSSNDTVALLHTHLRWLQTNPGVYFQPDTFQSGYAAQLGHFLPYDLYCFFTAEALPEGKSRVILIEHPNKPELSRKVFASEKVVRSLEKGAKLKVRTHLVEEKYVHWSNDPAFYTPFLSHLSPVPTESRTGMQLMESWQGTEKDVDLHRYYEVFTDVFPFFLFPHPDAIVQVTIPYQGEVPAAATGFDAPANPFLSTNNNDSFFDGMATGMMIDSMTSSTHTHHDHLSDIS